MSSPKPEVGSREQYLAEANAELDAMLGEVGTIEPAPEEKSPETPSWVRLLVVAAIAVIVFAVGVLLLRGGRRRTMSLNLVR